MQRDPTVGSVGTYTNGLTHHATTVLRRFVSDAICFDFSNFISISGCGEGHVCLTLSPSLAFQTPLPLSSSPHVTGLLAAPHSHPFSTRRVLVAFKKNPRLELLKARNRV